MRRRLVPLMAAVVAGTMFLAGGAAAHGKPKHSKPKHGKPKSTAPACTIQNAGGVPSSSAVGGWSYDVGFRCPFALKSFSAHTNKTLLSGVDKFGTKVPYAYAQLNSGQQANFTCELTSTKAVTCTVSPALPAHIVIVDGFDSSTACTNTKNGQLQATLAVNGRATPVTYIIGKKPSRTVTGGCG